MATKWNSTTRFLPSRRQVAYRLTPESGAYHFTDRKDNMTLLLSAYLNL